MILLRERVRRRRLQALTAAVIVLLGLLVAWEHSGASEHEMADEMGAVVGAICLAVVEAIGLAVAAAATRRARAAQRPILALPSTAFRKLIHHPVRPPPRPSPVELQVFLH